MVFCHQRIFRIGIGVHYDRQCRAGREWWRRVAGEEGGEVDGTASSTLDGRGGALGGGVAILGRGGRGGLPGGAGGAVAGVGGFGEKRGRLGWCCTIFVMKILL
jgi:hypothetical protein